MLKRIYIFLILLIFLSFKLTSASFAAANFSTNYDVVYNVSSEGNTHVNLNVTLNNLTDKYYASSYSVQVGFTDIRNLSARDSSGDIVPKITKSTNGSTINLNFNNRVVGIGNKLNFDISFDTKEIAQNLNHVWDINVPGISSQSDFSSFNVTVNYPPSIGKPRYIKPSLSSTPLRSIGKLYFTKEDLGDSGISIAFGDFQIYNLDLEYHLENKNVFPISTEIALPPNTNYQDVLIDNISPKPVNVKRDPDGNWLAQYNINSSNALDVSVKSKIKVYLEPKKENLDSNALKRYLKSGEYWNVGDEKIITLAKQLKTPYAIYQYVIKTLSYDFSRIETNSPRLGSLKALNSPNSAVCLEFTDLFIALSRAAGIPAREIDGYAYTYNSSERPLSLVKDILHAWPEYYDFDKKTWIMVDPTWGDTTGGIDYFNVLDFDHISFVIKGENSNYPVPAGGYKLSANQDTKDVSVEIGNSFDVSRKKISESIKFSDEILAGLPTRGYITVSNLGNTILDKTEIDVSTSVLNPRNQLLISEDIPPYGHQTIPVEFDKTPILTNREDTIRITSENSSSYKNVIILPFFLNKLFLLGGFVFVIVSIIISAIAITSRRIYLQRQQRKSNLRWESNQFKK